MILPPLFCRQFLQLRCFPDNLRRRYWKGRKYAILFFMAKNGGETMFYSYGGKSVMKVGKIVKIAAGVAGVMVLAGVAAAGNYFIGRGGSYYQTAEDGSETYTYVNGKNSVWGFSAGGRLSQLWGLDNEYGYQRYGLPSPAATILAYSGWYDEDFAGCYGTQPPTFFAYVKEDKVIGQQNVKDIEKTIDIMEDLDKDIEVRSYDHAYHGFGTGAGTDADGWMDEAISFWEKAGDKRKALYK